jgi:ABC-type multidrug transport system fused ATPase/permease subunit
VLAACALRDELLALSHGDLTRIDAQAATLNFGQKQRIILARALYQRPTLMFLDDVLSASGQLVEEVVMKELLGRDGLLRKLNAAAVIATRTGRFNGIADNLITIDQQRNIQLCTNNPKLDDFIFSSDPRRYKYHGEIEGSNSSDDNCTSNQTIPCINTLQEVNRNDSDFGDYAFYFRSMTWTWVLLFFLFAATQTICYYMSQIILQWWTADGGMNIAKWMPLYFAMACGNAVFFGVTVWTMFLRLVPESAAHLHRVLLDTVTNATYLFLASADVGVTLNRFSQDMTLIESQLPTGVLCTTIYLLWTIGSLALICTGSSWMALTVPAVLLALFFVQWVYLRTSRRLRVIELESRSPLYAHFLDTIKGLSAIRTLHWEQQFTGSMIRKLDDSQIPYYLLFCAQRWLQLVLDLIIAALAVIVMTLAVNLRGATNAGSLGLSLNNILSFNDILSFLLQYWTQLEVSLGSIARIRQFAKETPVERASSAHRHLPQTWPTSGSIELCDVSAGYGASNEVFRHVTMSVRPGAKIGLCGRTGSGKTSLLLLFLGLLEPSRGSVSIDGVDLRSIPLADIQAGILTIPQDTLLVQQKTVRFNVDPDGKCTDAQVLSAFSHVGLWPMLEKKGGLHAVVTSEFLSASQRQLFGIARLLLMRDDRYKSVGDGKQKGRSTGGVLLLDDATSKLDTATRIAIQRLFQEEFSGYTVITAVAADQLHTILDSDQIAVLDGGSLVDFGRAEELLARDSVFRRMYEATEGTSLETMLRQPAC